MQNLTGSYVWHYVSDEHKIVGVKESREYLVCFEVEEKSGPVWKMKLVHWFEKGAMISICESDGTPHDFRIKEDGFYIQMILVAAQPRGASSFTVSGTGRKYPSPELSPMTP